jgi:hypothetical protein
MAAVQPWEDYRSPVQARDMRGCALPRRTEARWGLVRRPELGAAGAEEAGVEVVEVVEVPSTEWVSVWEWDYE